MIRFIIKRKLKDASNGLETEWFQTIVVEAPELERLLEGGGMGPGSYDVRELIGAETGV